MTWRHEVKTFLAVLDEDCLLDALIDYALVSYEIVLKLEIVSYLNHKIFANSPQELSSKSTVPVPAR